MRDGVVVQAGRPEELVGAPADDYVADFVRDVPKAHVLTLRWIMRDPTAEDADGRPVVPGRHAASAAPSTSRPRPTKPIRVIDGDRVVGVVDRAQILTAIAGVIEGEA